MRYAYMVLWISLGCGGDRRPADLDDAGSADAFSDAFGDGALDGGASDGGFPDSTVFGDAGADTSLRDATIDDAEPVDGDLSDGAHDAGHDGGFDGGLADCLSGASGTHVVRFRWEGTSSGGRATVRLEENTLPDTSRWRANAYSRSIGYTPVWRDPFLGEGGLELSGTVFIDVELSTAGLGSVSNATLAIYGRSYNTTTSGSFEWMTFSGAGASPSGGVSNSAPYEWYGANATSALPAGDDAILLRIEAGPPSNALIVNRVEICFTAS